MTNLYFEALKDVDSAAFNFTALLGELFTKNELIKQGISPKSKAFKPVIVSRTHLYWLFGRRFALPKGI